MEEKMYESGAEGASELGENLCSEVPERRATTIERLQSKIANLRRRLDDVRTDLARAEDVLATAMDHPERVTAYEDIASVLRY